MAFADVNGTRLYYEDHGTGSRALLFLHGFTLDHRMWRAQVEGLARAHRVIVYDGRGFGRSLLPEKDQAYRHCDDAAALLEHLGVRQVIAVGHSIGAHQLLELAIERPDLVTAYVSIAMSGLVGSAGIPFPDHIMELFRALKATSPTDLAAAKQLWRKGDWFATARKVPALAEQLDAILADFSGWHWQNANPVKNIDPPAGDRLAEMKRPALIITGALDLAYNTELSERLVAGLPNATALRVENAGHMTNMEAPDEINRALERFSATT